MASVTADEKSVPCVSTSLASLVSRYCKMGSGVAVAVFVLTWDPKFPLTPL